MREVSLLCSCRGTCLPEDESWLDMVGYSVSLIFWKKQYHNITLYLWSLTRSKRSIEARLPARKLTQTKRLETHQPPPPAPLRHQLSRSCILLKNIYRYYLFFSRLPTWVLWKGYLEFRNETTLRFLTRLPWVRWRGDHNFPSKVTLNFSTKLPWVLLQ